MPEKSGEANKTKAKPERLKDAPVQRYPAEPHDLIDESSEESFPASDPPSWTPNVGEGTPRKHKTQDQNKTEGKKKRKDAA